MAALTLPSDPEAILALEWIDFAVPFAELTARRLDAAGLDAWMRDWSTLARAFQEQYARLSVATTTNTADEAADARMREMLERALPNFQAAEQRLKERLLASGLQPAGFEVPLAHMRIEAELFRVENLPLNAEEGKLGLEYDRVTGAQTVDWDGEELTMSQVDAKLEEPDRAVRERAWRAYMDRKLRDRGELNDLWRRFMRVRVQKAHITGIEGDMREYMFRERKRDYAPQDCERFHAAIEAVVVPAAGRVYERRRQQLGVDSLRPWDTECDPAGRPPLRPFQTVGEMNERCEAVFRAVDPHLGERFAVMRRENLLDLESRKNKAGGGYCTSFPVAGRPFIFMNSVGTHDDVQTMLHEAGHCFHVFESGSLPYYQQTEAPLEFCEVASMAMELLAAPYLTEPTGFYTPAEAARARTSHLESTLLFWPYMAVVDAFQHWVYANPGSAMDPAECDAAWGREYGRFVPHLDWGGLEDERVTGWHRKLHIFQVPLYYVEYGLASLGAVQVYRNAGRDQSKAVADYKRALALGGTRRVPDLFEAAGVRFGFDEPLLRDVVDVVESAIEGLADQARA